MSPTVPALEKGLQVIELILSSNEALSMSQIAETLGYKVSEAQRTIEYLTAERYLSRGLSGAYSPGPKAYGLADKCRDSSLVARAEGPMRRFALNRHASIHLGILVDHMLHIVYNVEGGDMVRVSVKPGLYDANDSVSGRLLLAYHREDPAGTAGEQTSGAIRPDDSPSILRQRGWNWGEISCAPGVHIIAVCLATGTGPCTAVLASPYLSTDKDTDEPRLDLYEGLLIAAQEIGSFY